MKQVEQIQIGVYAPNKRVFFGYPKLFRVWNIQHSYKPDFRGEAVTTSLNGNDRANIMGYRDTMTIDLNNSYGLQAISLRTLMNQLASNSIRRFWPGVSSSTPAIGSIKGQDVVVNNMGTDQPVPSITHFNNLYLHNITRKELRKITDHNSARNTEFTVEGDISNWQVGDGAEVALPIGTPSLIGASTDDSESNIGYYNLSDGAFGINRELTIGNQLIRIDFRGIERRTNIPGKIVI